MTSYILEIEDRDPLTFDAGDIEAVLEPVGAHNVCVFADGTVACEADDDPSEWWDSFRPTVRKRQ